MEMVAVLAVGLAWSALRLMRCRRCGVPNGALQALAATTGLTVGCRGCRLVARYGIEPAQPRRAGASVMRAAGRHLARMASAIRDRATSCIRVIDPRWEQRREVARWLRTNPPAMGRSTGAKV